MGVPSRVQGLGRQGEGWVFSTGTLAWVAPEVILGGEAGPIAG